MMEKCFLFWDRIKPGFLLFFVFCMFFWAVGQKEVFDLEFILADFNDTVPVYRLYIARHPGTKYAAAASRRIEELAFLSARRQGSVGAYNDFIKEYPSSRMIPKAVFERDNLVPLRRRGSSFDWYNDVLLNR